MEVYPRALSLFGLGFGFELGLVLAFFVFLDKEERNQAAPHRKTYGNDYRAGDKQSFPRRDYPFYASVFAYSVHARAVDRRVQYAVASFAHHSYDFGIVSSVVELVVGRVGVKELIVAREQARIYRNIAFANLAADIVGKHSAHKAPFVAQNAGDERLVSARPSAAYAVVRGHDGGASVVAGFALAYILVRAPYHDFERTQIKLAERLLVAERIESVTVGLLVVEREVL